MMSFARPSVLWLVPFVALWGVSWGFALARNYRNRQRQYGHIARVFRRVPVRALTAKLAGQGLLTFALMALAVALARPQGAAARLSGAQRGVNLALMIDSSRSMLCEDVLPNRLQLARQATERIATDATGSRFSLFMFGGGPTLLIPRTFDATAVALAVRNISPDMVGKGGTALAPAIERATAYLQKAGSQPKVIVILSDGEEGEGDPVLAALQAHAQHGVRIHTIAIGTERGGPMPVFKRNTRGELVRNGTLLSRAQVPIITRANLGLMQKIAAATGGRSLQLIDGDVMAQVTHFVTGAITPEAVPLDDTVAEAPREWYWVPLLAAVVALLAEHGLRQWAARRTAKPRPAQPRASILMRPTVAEETR